MNIIVIAWRYRIGYGEASRKVNRAGSQDPRDRKTGSGFLPRRGNSTFSGTSSGVLPLGQKKERKTGAGTGEIGCSERLMRFVSLGRRGEIREVEVWSSNGE